MERFADRKKDLATSRIVATECPKRVLPIWFLKATTFADLNLDHAIGKKTVLSRDLNPLLEKMTNTRIQTKSINVQRIFSKEMKRFAGLRMRPWSAIWRSDAPEKEANALLILSDHRDSNAGLETNAFGSREAAKESSCADRMGSVLGRTIARALQTILATTDCHARSTNAFLSQ